MSFERATLRLLTTMLRKKKERQTKKMIAIYFISFTYKTNSTQMAIGLNETCNAKRQVEFFYFFVNKIVFFFKF